jgi:endothelin-converting enzyme/putative endopeptidase
VIRSRVAFVLGVSFVLAAGRPAPAADDRPLQGIELSDMNRSVEACSDFYEFANGSWRAKNPIPASMPRWSRRWEAGEQSKDRLKGILEEAAAVKGAPKGSVDQLIGDFYGACMDEAAIDRAGVKPIEPYRAQIRAIKTPAEVAGMITKFQRSASRFRSRFSAARTTTTRTTSSPRSPRPASGCRIATTT